MNVLAMSLRNLVADARAHGLTVIDLAAIERLLAEHDRRERQRNHFYIGRDGGAA